MNTDLIAKGREEFENNEGNFHWEFRKHFREEEFPMDETASIKVFYNENFPMPNGLFRFEYDLPNWSSTATNYYPHDFRRDYSRNVDEPFNEGDEVQIMKLWADEIPPA